MSKPVANSSAPDELAFEVLERAITKALAHIEALEDRLTSTEARSAELGEVVKRFTGEEGEADRILTRLQALEEENGDLRQRLEQGREGIDRLLAKIRFLENHE